MKTIITLFLFSASNIFADIPRLPPAEEYACMGKNTGDACLNKDTPKKSGICVMQNNVLVCAAQVEKVLSTSVKNLNSTETLVKEEILPGKNEEKSKGDGDVPIPEGCNNVPLTGGAISFMSILLGFLLMRKARK